MDATDITAHAAMVEAGIEALGHFDVALIAHGTLPDQAACERDAALTLREFATNGGSVIALLTILANRFEEQRNGAIAVITSVAGDRGRPSNYVYGSAKAAVSVFCEGLRARLFKAGVSLTDIRPGFVATPMTQGLPLPAALVAQPQTVARRIVTGIDRRKDVLYAPAFWAWIMAVIRNIPGFIFKRMKL
jgi:short-subunit dehydrogenase